MRFLSISVVLEVLSFKNNHAHLSGEKEFNGASGVSIF